jgi:EmrB/QacA subfamily drug resistance transporter
MSANETFFTRRSYDKGLRDETLVSMVRCMTQLMAAAAASDLEDEARIPWRAFAVTVAGAFVVALDLSIVNVAFPSIEASFRGASTTTLSWVLSGYSVVFGALLLGAGRLADRSGRRASFLRGLIVFTVGSLLCGAAPSAGLLIGGRVVQAVGAALLMPASLALLLAATHPAARPQAVAMWGGISALAVATGPSLGSVLIDAGGWRWAFLVNLPVALLAGFGALRWLEESKVGGARPDLAGIAVLSAGVALLALGITQGQDWGWTSSRVLGAFAAAVALAAVVVRRGRTHAAPALDLRLFESRTVGIANAATVAYGIGFFAMLLCNVLFLTNVWGYSTLRAGLAITPGPLVVAALSRSTGAWATRFGYGRVLVLGGLVFASAQVWCVVVVGDQPRYLAQWLVPSLLGGLGVALTFPVLSAAAVAGLPADRFAAGGALNQTARQLGAVLGVALLVALLGSPTSPAAAHHRLDHVWVLCAAAGVVSSLVSSLHLVGPRTAQIAEIRA